jgi:hypothetical protein
MAFAFGAQAIDLTLAPQARSANGGAVVAPEMRFASAVVAAPYLKLIRTPEGWSSDAALRAATGDEKERPQGAAGLVVSEVHVRDGTLQIADDTTTPSLAIDLKAVNGSLREVRGPTPIGVGEFELQGMDAQLGAWGVSGARGGNMLRADVSAPDFALGALAPYLRRVGSPWAFQSGRGAAHAVLLLGGDGWTADTTLTLREPVLGGDLGMLERSLGARPAAALAAVYDRHGEIMLRLPLASPRASDAGGLTEAFASGVRDALARPRWTALPDGAIEIAFAPGMTELAPDAERRLGAIADVMAARHDVVLELRGVVSRQDRRWFAEQAIAEDGIAAPGGFSVLLRAVGVHDQRMRIRDALAARAAGEEGRLRPDDETALAALVAQRPPVPDERLIALAAARTTRVADLLADRHRVTVTRVVPAEPAAPERMTAVVDARFLPYPGTGPR